MSIQVLQRIAGGPLPLTVEGPDVPAVESLIEAGLIEGTVSPCAEAEGKDWAVVQRITALGALYLRSFPPT